MGVFTGIYINHLVININQTLTKFIILIFQLKEKYCKITVRQINPGIKSHYMTTRDEYENLMKHLIIDFKYIKTP